jgi:acyl-coenzyme A thioesterase PaaI-like protein
MSDKAKALETLLRQAVPFYEYMDIRVEQVDDGVYRVRAPLLPQTTSHVGTVHAPIQWAAAEALGGIVALDVFGGLEDIFLVVRNVNYDFLKAARTDVIAETRFDAEAAAKLKADVAGGEGHIEIAIQVLDENGTEVAKATGRYLVRPRRDKAA